LETASLTNNNDTNNEDGQISEPAVAMIPAGSRRQAMDWSLVLLSQGINPTIECAEEVDRWFLKVSPAEHNAALLSIQQYQAENRPWPWQREIFQPGYLFDWAALGWAVLICAFFWLSDIHAGLRSAGMMDSAAAGQGQWWRLFTAIWLHADTGHLATNAVIGVILLGFTMGRYGTGLGLLAACLTGVGGNLAAWLLWPTAHRSLGASGLVMGCLGLLAVQTFPLWRHTPRATRVILSGIGGGLMLFLLMGVTPGTDVIAHFGGFVSGLLLGGFLNLFAKTAQRPSIQLASGLVFALLVTWPWWLALN
jgi:rhomboid protease GluP